MSIPNLFRRAISIFNFTFSAHIAICRTISVSCHIILFAVFVGVVCVSFSTTSLLPVPFTVTHFSLHQLNAHHCYYGQTEMLLNSKRQSTQSTAKAIFKFFIYICLHWVVGSHNFRSRSRYLCAMSIASSWAI